MQPDPPLSTLVVASHNAGKVGEITDLLAPHGLKVLSATDVGLPEPAETGTTFQENAELKARLAAQTCGLPCLADDSGLCVTALNGEPGIYSARWAGVPRNFEKAIEKINNLLEYSDDKAACFACVLSVAWPDGRIVSVEGRTEGTLTFPPRGKNGFGYDPIFVPEGHSKTFGEMTAMEKKALSHRMLAFKKLLEILGL